MLNRKLGFIIFSTLTLSFSAYGQANRVNTSTERRDSVLPGLNGDLVFDVETTYGSIERKDGNEKSEISTFKVKPTLGLESEKFRFKGFVPLTWAESKFSSSDDGSSSKDSTRIVGRPDFLGQVKLADERLALGLGLKAPLFSASDLDAELFRYTQYYFKGDLNQPLSGTVQLIATAKIEKDLSKSKTESFSIGGETYNVKTTNERGAIFRGFGGFQFRPMDVLTLGSGANFIYSLEATEARSSLVSGPTDVASSSFKSGASKYINLEVFGELKFSTTSSLRGSVKKSVTSNIDNEGSTLILQSIDEVDEIADLAASLSFINRF